MMILPGIEAPKIASSGEKTETESGKQGSVSDAFSRQIDAARRAMADNTDSASPATQEASEGISEKFDRLKRLSEQQGKRSTAEHQATLTLIASQTSGADPATREGLGRESDTDKRSSDLQAISALLGMLPAPPPVENPATPAIDRGNFHHKATEASLSPLPDTLPSSPAGSAGDTSDAAAGGTEPPSQIKSSADLLPTGLALQSTQTAAVSQPVAHASFPATADPAALAQPSAPLNAQLGSEAWQQQLSQQVTLFTRQGIAQAELRLHPEHLGKLDISLKFDDNQLQLQIMSPHSHVRAALEAALPALRTSLSESGVQLGQSQVGDENLAQQQAGDQGEQPASRTPRFSFSGEDEEELISGVSTTLQQLANRQGAVDIFA